MLLPGDYDLSEALQSALLPLEAFADVLRDSHPDHSSMLHWLLNQSRTQLDAISKAVEQDGAQPCRVVYSGRNWRRV